MRNWIFVVINQKGLDGPMSAGDIYRGLMQKQLWGWDQKPRNFQVLKAGDRVVFYLGYPQMQFAGTATLKDEPYPRSENEKQTIGKDLRIDPGEYGIHLAEVQQWDSPRDAKPLMQSLSFIKNTKNTMNWGVYLKGSIRELSDDDFEVIVKGSPPPALTPDLESESDFVLEAHLEEFIDGNWDSIKFGRKLRLYSDGDTKGRQFPAGKWSIDFLTVDQETNDFVIIELKRGKTSDAVVGQAARYMVWVRENLAKPGQQVFAIIIAHEADEALRTAVRIDPKLSLKEYKISFDLQEVRKS